MDSDSSIDDEMDRARWNQGKALHSRNNMNDTSDVSDEENISRAARSIESPPESPQGGHFESPPASPDSTSPPHSPDDSGSSRRGSESPINSPESYHSDRQGSMSPNRSEASVSPLPSASVSQSPHHKFSRQKVHDNHSPVHSTPQRSESELSRQERHSPVHSPSSSVRSVSQRSESRLSRPDRDSPNHSPSSSIHSPHDSDNHFLRQERGSPNHSSNSFIQSPHQGNESISSKQERESQNNSPHSYINSPQSPSMPPQVDNDIASPTHDDGGHISDSNSDDGRSNISSVSSFGSSTQHSPPSTSANKNQSNSVPTRVKTAAELKSHAEDLSDVSDLESLDSVSDDEVNEKETNEKQVENCEVNKNVNKSSESKTDTNSGVRSSTAAAGLEGEDTEQLDFEAEEKEEGECEGISTATAITMTAPNSTKTGGGSEDEGELKNDELEEGELTDEGENRPEETEPRPICRFYNRGQCTWGSSCRFVHPGVTDKGNYTMFELVRPLVPVNGPPQMYPPMEYRPVERPVVGLPSYQAFRKEEAVPVVESAWERGLRQAKEMLRKSSKRKETEVDFEEKKMNLTLGQDELDKENDYYTRSASPILNEEPDRWSGKIDGDPKRYRTVSERYEADYGPESAYYHSGSRSGEVWHHRGHHYVEEGVRSSRLVRGDPDYQSSSLKSKYSSSSHYYPKASSHEYYERKRHKYPSREVIVQRSDKSSWKDDSPTAPSRSSRHVERGGRGDEWADPWMRSKSPLGRKTRSRKQSYSSGSSYSSSSSSRTSRSSSGSSYSRDTRSRSRSSRSRSRSKKPTSPVRRLTRPSPPFNKSKPLSPGLIMSEKRAATERAMHMNPPPPSPRKVRGPTSPPAPLRRNPTPPTAADNRTRGGGVPPRLLAHSKAAVAAAMRSTRSRSKSSRSSSGSDSSGSSSDSSETSITSTSSSRVASPPARQKRIVIDERLALAQAMKVKAMDALKLSGQKQQIKLTLKGSSASQVDRPPSSVTAGKKRPAESPPAYIEESSPPKVGGKTTPKKPAPSRREELLKQLKAVEDAIARKRSKIV